MRTTTVSDPVFDRILTGSDRIIHNILYRIREGADASVWTDDRTFLMAQSNPNTPVWLALLQCPDGETRADIVQVLLSLLAANPATRLTVNETLGAEILADVERSSGRKAKIVMPMAVYGCFATREIPVRGCATVSTPKDVDVIAELLRQDSMDAEGIEVSLEDSLAYARSKIGSNRLILWRDGSVVSMAGVAHLNEKYARIAPVVTERTMRGRGYAPMLVKALADALLQRNVIPMLYADARNPSSNRAYQKIGFEKQGELTTYVFSAP